MRFDMRLATQNQNVTKRIFHKRVCNIFQLAMHEPLKYLLVSYFIHWKAGQGGKHPRNLSLQQTNRIDCISLESVYILIIVSIANIFILSVIGFCPGNFARREQSLEQLCKSFDFDFGICFFVPHSQPCTLGKKIRWNILHHHCYRPHRRRVWCTVTYIYYTFY